MNKVYLIGNLTRDPETRTTQSGITVCNFTLAVNRRFKNENGGQECDFLNITAWRQLGELCQRYLSKGKKCAVSGSIQTRTYEAQDGGKRTAWDIVADEVEFLSSGQRNDQQGHQGNAQSAPAPGAYTQAVSKPAEGYTQVETDELPF